MLFEMPAAAAMSCWVRFLSEKEVRRRERQPHAEAPQVEDEQECGGGGVDREAAGEPAQDHGENTRDDQQERFQVTVM